MALHAVDDLSDAYRASKDFLLPFTWGRWLRLALLSIFIAGGSGGGGGAPPNGFQYSMDAGDPFGPQVGAGFERLGDLIQANLGLLIGLVVVGIAVALVFAWIAAVFEFSFLESLRSEEVHVRQYFGRFNGMGTRLFAFRLLFGLGLAILFGGVFLLAIGPVALGFGAAPLLLLVILAPVLFIVGLLASIVYVLTTAFVVPIMLHEDRGVLSAWGRFWQTLKTDWEQFLVFILVGLFVMIVFGIILGIVTAILGVVVAIPFAILGFLIYFGTGGVFGPLLLVVLGIPLALVLVLVGALVQVPLQTYLRYWALLILGDVDEELDLIPEQRAAIRDETPS